MDCVALNYLESMPQMNNNVQDRLSSITTQGLFQGGGKGGGAFAPPGNLVAPPRNLFVGPENLLEREREM